MDQKRHPKNYVPTHGEADKNISRKKTANVSVWGKQVGFLFGSGELMKTKTPGILVGDPPFSVNRPKMQPVVV